MTTPPPPPPPPGPAAAPPPPPGPARAPSPAAAARPTLKDRVEFAAYRGLSALLNALPEGWAVTAGIGLGWLAGSVLRVRRRVVDANLALAFPDKDARWRRRVARESYRNLGREAVVALRSGRRGASDVLARSQVRGLDAMIEAAAGPGAILATGHVGNWEVGGGALALRGAPIDVVAVRQRNRLFDRALVASRERLGMRVVHRGRGGGELLAVVRSGRILGLLADQDAGRSGVFVDFLGRPASTARGPALLTLRSGARLFGAACVAEPGRPRRYVVHVEALEVERTGDLAEDVRRLTQAHADFLAGFVRRFPEQYFWQHKRWKTRPRGGEEGQGAGEDLASAPALPERPPGRPV